MNEISVLIVDDHPALREGLHGLLDQEPGFDPIGALRGGPEVLTFAAEQRPDVVILDYALHRGDGLSLCFELKQLPDPPAVVLYSGYVDGAFAVPATLAQADAVLSKSAPVDQLLDLVRAVARGERHMPFLLPEAMTAAASRLAPSELPIAGMLFAGVSVVEIAETLRVHPAEIRRRATQVILDLQTRVRTGVPSARWSSAPSPVPAST